MNENDNAQPEARGREPEGSPMHEADSSDRRSAVRKHRRVVRPAVEGSDPTPLNPPMEPRSERENDERLKGDKPPHWG